MNRRWTLFHIIAILTDGLILIYAGINHITWLLVLYTISAMLGASFMVNIWNKDERTDTAISDASRTAINSFLVVTTLVGILFIVLSSIGIYSSTLWIIGATAVILGLFLFFLQAIFALSYADELSR